MEPQRKIYLDIESVATNTLASFGLHYVCAGPVAPIGNRFGIVVETGPTTSLQTLRDAELHLADELGFAVELTTSCPVAENDEMADCTPVIPGTCLLHPRDELQEPARRVVDTIERIQRYVHPCSEESFLADTLTQDAVLQNLRMLGLAISDVTDLPGVKEDYPEIEPWFGMILHALVPAHTDWHVLWNTIHRDLPVLQHSVQDMMRTLQVPVEHR